MFDNEIDWVTRLERRSGRREAQGMAKTPDTLIYKAEHMRSRLAGSGKCSSKKSVFRRYGYFARERISPVSEAENRLSPRQDRSDSAPCVELILWSSY